MALVASPPVTPENAPASRSSLDSLAALADRRWICWLFLSGYCGWLFSYGLTEGEFYRTESLRAIIAAEFLRSGNWIVPRLYGDPLFTEGQPPDNVEGIDFGRPSFQVAKGTEVFIGPVLGLQFGE